MTNLEFIRKEFYSKSNKEKKRGSLFRDGAGNIYSYGYHYPLLFTIGNSSLVFINVTGYSQTTSRHITHAKRAVGYEYVAINLDGKRLNELTLSSALELLELEASQYKEEMKTKKRKDTKTYDWLEEKLSDVELRIAKVKDELRYES